jgi:galactoside 2-L-fucosyltransferase 1/2
VAKKADEYIRRVNNQTKILIAVHVRRGDMVFHFSGYVVPKKDYFEKAMSHFRKKFPRHLFHICSDGMDWAKRVIRTVDNDVILVEGNKPEVDVAIMARSQHTIMSVGTFGWWAAWLARGEAIYYKTPARAGSWLEKQFNYSDYYLPKWMAMK